LRNAKVECSSLNLRKQFQPQNKGRYSNLENCARKAASQMSTKAATALLNVTVPSKSEAATPYPSS